MAMPAPSRGLGAKLTVSIVLLPLLALLVYHQGWWPVGAIAFCAGLYGLSRLT